MPQIEINSPLDGSHTGTSFDVAGWTDDTGPVTVSVAGQTHNNVPVANENWSTSFNNVTTGPQTVSASVGGTSDSADITVDQDPPIRLSSIQQGGGNPPTYTVTGTYFGPKPSLITVIFQAGRPGRRGLRVADIKLAAIDQPQAGQWTVTMTGAAGSNRQVAQAASFDANGNLIAWASRRRP